MNTGQKAGWTSEVRKADALAFTKHLYRVQHTGLRNAAEQRYRFLYRQG